MNHRIARHRRSAVKAPVELLGVKARAPHAHFKGAVASLVFLVKGGLRKNPFVVHDDYGCSVFDVANGVVGRQADSVGSAGEPNAGFKQG